MSTADTEPFETLFIGYFEELKSSLNKIMRACRKGDTATAFFRSSTIQNEIAQFLCKAEVGLWFENSDSYETYRKYYDSLINIDLVSNINDLGALETNVIKLEKAFTNLLRKNNVDILNFTTIDEFEKHYQGE